MEEESHRSLFIKNLKSDVEPKNSVDNNNDRSYSNRTLDQSGPIRPSINSDCIRVGPEFQAVIPETPPPPCGTRSLDARDLVQWVPNPSLSDEDLETYLESARLAHGYEEDQALGMLFFHDYDLGRAMGDLPNFVPEADEWTEEEKVLFREAYDFHGKDFEKFACKLPYKSMGSIIRFYYSHKRKSRKFLSTNDRAAAAAAAAAPAEGGEGVGSEGAVMVQYEEPFWSTPTHDSALPSPPPSKCSPPSLPAALPHLSPERRSADDERKRVSVLPPLTFLQLLGCARCSLYFGTSRSQRAHMETRHPEEENHHDSDSFDFSTLAPAEGADHLLQQCACVPCRLFFLDPLLKTKHADKFHKSKFGKSLAVECFYDRLPFDLAPAHTSHNHLRCNECSLPFPNMRHKYDHNRNEHSMKFDFPDIDAAEVAEAAAAASAVAAPSPANPAKTSETSAPSEGANSFSSPQANWSREEILGLLQAVGDHGPNFFLIAAKVPTKTVAQIRKFYFSYKKKYNLDRIEDGRERNGAPDNCAAAAAQVERRERPVRQRRAKKAAKYVETSDVEEEEEDELQQEEEERERSGVEDNEGNDPNFKSEDEEASDDSSKPKRVKSRSRKSRAVAAGAAAAAGVTESRKRKSCLSNSTGRAGFKAESVRYFPPTRAPPSVLPLSIRPVNPEHNPNLAADPGAAFSADAVSVSEEFGPERAIAHLRPIGANGQTGGHWRSAETRLPQSWSCRLSRPAAVATLVFQIVEGGKGGGEFADPSSFIFEAKSRADDDWTSLIRVDDAANSRGRDLVFAFDNRLPFLFYRLVVLKTMAGEGATVRPVLGGVRLLESVHARF